ncbi:MAG TPA: uroporphyrinogen decarboxylase family protein, partial [Armatimonadota bacterium]|jgi:uroporphyrinogen-III decarboxylase
MDFYDDPEYAKELLEFITEATIRRIKAWRRYLGQPEKTPEFAFADDSIQLISEATYREFVLPCHRRLVNELGEGGRGFIHLCGDASRHFKMLRDELNIYSFDTGFPVDFAWLRKELGLEVEIFGGPHIEFLRTTTPEQVCEKVRSILSSGICQGGKFVLREGNNLAPLTPVENIQAMYDTLRGHAS